VGFDLLPAEKGTAVTLFIDYEPPHGWFYRVLSFLFARWYCRWCLNSMLKDTQKALETAPAAA
jgi:hypothetical protein